jgi:hypothetical protein
MFKRITPVLALAAAFWTAALLAPPARATDETSNLQFTRSRASGVPGDRIEPIATPTGDDDMPNRTVRRPPPIPQSSSVDSLNSTAGAPAAWYSVLWQRVLWFGSKVVFFMKA